MVSTVRRVAGATGIAALLLVGGCSAQPGVAAVVDGRTITQGQLETAAQDLSVIGDVDATPLLRIMILAPVLIEGAEENGVGVSEAEARSSLEQNWRDAQQAALGAEGEESGAEESAEFDDGPEMPEFGAEAIEVRRFELAASKLEQHPDAQQIFTELAADAQALDVELNPRYGTFDVETLAITPETSPWIVAPSPES